MNDMQNPVSTAFATAPVGAAPVRVGGPGAGILTPRSLEEAFKMADILANSSLVPKDFIGKPGNVLIACQWGAELGLAPLQAMQSIAVINGRPSIWGDAMLALVRGSGALEFIDERISDDGENATCTVKRKGDIQPVVRTFSMDDAKRAGLSGKQGPWQQYPKRMLQLRARGFALRDAFPDVLRGVWIAEEAQDTPVMRDVTPPDADTSKATTKTQKVRGKIAEKTGHKADEAEKLEPSLDDLLREMTEAATEDDLSKVGAKAAKLSDSEQKAKARQAYSARLHKLRQAAADALRAAEDRADQGDMFSGGSKPDHNRTFSSVTGDLMDDAPIDVIISTYGEKIAAMRRDDPDLFARLMDEIDGFVSDGSAHFTA